MDFDAFTVADRARGAHSSAMVRAGGIEWTQERAGELMRYRRPVPYVVGNRVVARNAVKWVREQTDLLASSPIRADRRRNLIRLVELIGKSWHALTKMSSPGHAFLAESLGVTRKTVERLILELIERGIIHRSGAGIKRVAPDGSTIYLRAEYALLRPQVLAARVVCGRCEIGFRPASPDDSLCRSCRELVERKRERQEASAWPLSTTPKRKRERHQAAAAMQEAAKASGWLADASPAAVASACRPFWQAGWTPADVMHAIEWRPDGPWRYDSRPADVPGWLRYRLSYWVRSDGRPRASRSQRSRAERAAAAAARETARAERERAEVERQRRRSEGPSAAQVQVWRVLAKARPSGVYAQRLRALGERLSTGENVAPSLPQGEGENIPTRARANAPDAAGGVEPPTGGDAERTIIATTRRVAQERRSTHPSPRLDPRSDCS